MSEVSVVGTAIHFDVSVPVENEYSSSVCACVTQGTTIIATMSNNFCKCFCMTITFWLINMRISCIIFSLIINYILRKKFFLLIIVINCYSAIV